MVKNWSKSLPLLHFPNKHRIKDDTLMMIENKNKKQMNVQIILHLVHEMDVMLEPANIPKY